MRVGFVGLGIMGSPMAKNLVNGKIELYVNDVNTAAVEELVAAGAQQVTATSELGNICEVIILMLPNAAIVKNVLFGENALSTTLKKGTAIVDMSSLSPVDTAEIYEKLAELHVHYLDAPVSGGQPKAIDGTLSVMIGGDEQVFRQVEPVLAHMASDLVYVGESGSGSTTKLANQILVNVTIAALSEAAVLASKAGVDLNKLHAAIRNGLAGSAVLDAKLPLMIDRNFVAGGRIDINLKDLMNVEQTGRELGVPLPLTSSVIGMLQALKADGKVADDHGGLVQYYEKLANYEMPKGGK
ncbi:NAD(P)-binding domain-containing protein [Metasolibacillus meyeri]|uniref:NAD(P)-binding domain-containing protein n=1 Tax=Metasolibacillus meyeri TaxID=1071052 RepID=A0AAW9NQ76_9BACL|nr:NAD(P)-binding domain-containing protein [Metasolibacillus meyeri]MEC1178175.1 NAD(P)-binding domain-containing protein [Metasolibacillus meyeri]